MRAGISITVTLEDRLWLDAIVGDRDAKQKHVKRANVILATAMAAHYCKTAEQPRPCAPATAVWCSPCGPAANRKCSARTAAPSSAGISRTQDKWETPLRAGVGFTAQPFVLACQADRCLARDVQHQAGLCLGLLTGEADRDRTCRQAWIEPRRATDMLGHASGRPDIAAS
jgi:hypothetical protein